MRRCQCHSLMTLRSPINGAPLHSRKRQSKQTPCDCRDSPTLPLQRPTSMHGDYRTRYEGRNIVLIAGIPSRSSCGSRVIYCEIPMIHLLWPKWPKPRNRPRCKRIGSCRPRFDGPPFDPSPRKPAQNIKIGILGEDVVNNCGAACVWNFEKNKHNTCILRM